ncbi:uncharacterized protein LOC127788340 [Diospyros lotus]|uniref:uncharacterized protein LOC127788340 n=1 Tax=Diospyros lotus TaxID=55363 RepID=UPI00224E42D3|nr:uncharacterized protein LOC127788340 [Diospyros lotus]
MGQSLQKLTPGNEEKKAKEIGAIAEGCYDKYFADDGRNGTKEWSSADFYHALCETIGEINKKLGSSTQFRVPNTETLNRVFVRHYKGKGKGNPLTKEEFEKILRDVMVETGFSGTGAKDIFFYIFGVPATALFFKQRFLPRAIPNELFIPAVTSATVFVLAKLNKI